MSLAARCVTLVDGRCISYEAHGPRTGHPVLFFHGTPASRENWRFFDDGALVEELGLRVIALDRPGIGRSSAHPARTIRSWVEDMRQFLDGVGIGRTSILAHSGGGPYALACALLIPERVQAVGLAASSPPYEEMPDLADAAGSARFLMLCRDRPRVARLVLRSMGLMARHFPSAMMRQAVASLPPADRDAMGASASRLVFLDMLAEALRQGAEGARLDGALMYGSWDLPIEQITRPVHLWHGTEDRNVPVAVARYLHGRMPTSVLEVLPDEGHLSLMARHARRMLTALAPQPGIQGALSA